MIDLTNPDDLRRLLDRFGNALPGAAEKLLARVAAGEPMTPADWRVDVWGPLGVDESPAHATLPDLLLWSHLMARPAAATATAMESWRLATADEGIPGFIPLQAARIARAALLREANTNSGVLAEYALADGATADLLARAWMRHARIFQASDELAPIRVSVPHFQHDGQPGPWWALVGGATHLRRIFAGYPADKIPAFLRPLEPWLNERDRELPKSTVDGVPWLSACLANYLRAELGEHGQEFAASWLDRERSREAERTADELPIILPPRVALPGWLVPVAVSRLEPGWGVSPAALTLARAVWWAEVRREVEDRRNREIRTVAPGVPLPFAGARATLATRVTVDGGAVLSGDAPTGFAVAPGVDLATWQAVASTLHTLSARRAVAWMARAAWLAHAAGERGTKGEGWEAVRQHDGSVLVTVHGGLSGLAAVLGLRGSNDGGEVFGALEALAGVVLSAQTKPDTRLTGALVAQVKRARGGPGRPGAVSCTLSPWWSPGAVSELVKNEDRVIVPVLPPPPVDVLAPWQRTHGAALEERALIALATNARAVVRYGGVALRWDELAHDLNPGEVARLVDNWRELRRWNLVKGDRWMLGTADSDLAAAGELIRRSGAMREGRAKGGRASVDKKHGGRNNR